MSSTATRISALLPGTVWIRASLRGKHRRRGTLISVQERRLHLFPSQEGALIPPHTAQRRGWTQKLLQTPRGLRQLQTVVTMDSANSPETPGTREAGLP